MEPMKLAKRQPRAVDGAVEMGDEVGHLGVEVVGWRVSGVTVPVTTSLPIVSGYFSVAIRGGGATLNPLSTSMACSRSPFGNDTRALISQFLPPSVVAKTKSIPS